MKRGFLYLLLGLASLSMISGCFIDFDDDDDDYFGCRDGYGPTVNRDIFLPPFEGIEVDIDADVYITQGGSQYVRVEAQDNIIDELDRDVHNGIWEIKADHCIRDYRELKIFITVPDMNYISISGSGYVFSQNTISGHDLTLRIPGSGDIDLSVDLKELDTKISGSGDLKLEGAADYSKYRISGSGDIRAFDLDSYDVDINISGSGDARVTAHDLLDIRISGSGDVYYRGTPVLNVNITGSGNVIDAN